jgi:perosamine synthetase
MNADIIAFIRGLYKGEKFIPLHAPVFRGNEKKYLNECIETTFVSSVGKFVDRFEGMLQDYTGTKKAVACVNGTNALYMALLLTGVEKNDEIITQPLTFVATANSISYVGAIPIFVDVDKDTMGLSPGAVDSWLKENAKIIENCCYNKKTNRRIKACVPMHTFGHPVRLNEMDEVCQRYKLELIEDAAESVGSFYNGKHTGTFGKIGVLSFNGNKTITTGGGGALLFQNENTGKLAKHLMSQAKLSHPFEFDHDQIGYNYRMPNINAALGCAQLEKIDYIINQKRLIAKNYKSFFEKKQKNIIFFSEPENSKSNYWLNAIIFENNVLQQDFLKYSNSEGVMARPIWKLLNRLPMFRKSQTGDLKNSEWFSDRVVNIPSGVPQKED